MEDLESVKKARTKHVYGVINQKWYAEDQTKTSAEALKLAGKVRDFEDREQIFDKNRKALMKMIRFHSRFSTEHKSLSCCTLGTVQG